MVKIQVLRYFSYTSIVVNRLATYIEDKDEGSFEVMELFEEGRIDLVSYNATMITLSGLKEELQE